MQKAENLNKPSSSEVESSEVENSEVENSEVENSEVENSEVEEQTSSLSTQLIVEPTQDIQPVEPLSPEEKHRLAAQEIIVSTKLQDFIAVGNALMQIKADNLHREVHRNFGKYCEIRWNFGRSYANKIIGSAERINLLPSTMRKPENEFQMRPFLHLTPEEFLEKWPTIINKVGDGKITSPIIIETLNLPIPKKKIIRVKKSFHKKQMKELVVSIRIALESGNVNDATEILKKMEKLLGI